MASAVQGTQSFARSISLLRHIADRSEPPALKDLLLECGLTRPSLYRMLAGLEAEGLILQTADKRYLPGPGLISLARKALGAQDIRVIARPALERLRDACGETVHLAMYSANAMVYIDKIESLQSVRMASMIGTRVALHSTGVGKAYLSALEPKKAEAMMQAMDLPSVTRFTATSHESLRSRIEQSRRQGYVFDDQENELGIVCYGAAILEAAYQPCACISISVPLYRHSADPAQYRDPLLACTAEISTLLGHEVKI